MLLLSWQLAASIGLSPFGGRGGLPYRLSWYFRVYLVCVFRRKLCKLVVCRRREKHFVRALNTCPRINNQPRASAFSSAN